MSFSVSTSKKKAKTIKKANKHADGTEQTLLEFEGEALVSGFVDLSEMQFGDTVIIRQYIKLWKTAEYQRYAKEEYNGIQNDPMVYLMPKRVDYAVKVTLEQSIGLFKNFDNTFIGED